MTKGILLGTEISKRKFGLKKIIYFKYCVSASVLRTSSNLTTAPLHPFLRCGNWGTGREQNPDLRPRSSTLQSIFFTMMFYCFPSYRGQELIRYVVSKWKLWSKFFWASITTRKQNKTKPRTLNKDSLTFNPGQTHLWPIPFLAFYFPPISNKPCLLVPKFHCTCVSLFLDCPHLPYFQILL